MGDGKSRKKIIAKQGNEDRGTKKSQSVRCDKKIAAPDLLDMRSPMRRENKKSTGHEKLQLITQRYHGQNAILSG